VSDESLFEQVQRGSQPALEELVAAYYAPLRAYFFRMMGGNLQDAEDLVQETFLRVLNYKGRLPKVFRFWIYTVARNLAYDRFRSASYKHEQVAVKHELQEVLENSPSLSGSGPEGVVFDRISAAAVRNQLEGLPVAQREVIVMRFYGDLKLEEIAEITGRPLGTVKSRLFKGLKRYKQILEEVEYAEG
jgi:RNA polymerase sigma-70 factor, ECF subfamily